SFASSAILLLPISPRFRCFTSNSVGLGGGAGLFGMGREHARELPGRGLQQARQFGRRRLNEADNLAAQLVQGGQRRQRLDRVRIERLAGQPAADDGQLVVAVGVLDRDLGGGDRVAREGDRGRAGEQRHQRL